MTFLEAMELVVNDVQTTLRRFGGNQALWERFVRKYPDDPTFLSLQRAIAGNDSQEIERAAHTLKGTAGNLGFQTLSDAAAALVSDVRAGADPKSNWLQTKTAYQAVIKAIENIR